MIAAYLGICIYKLYSISKIYKNMRYATYTQPRSSKICILSGFKISAERPLENSGTRRTRHAADRKGQKGPDALAIKMYNYLMTTEYWKIYDQHPAIMRPVMCKFLLNFSLRIVAIVCHITIHQSFRLLLLFILLFILLLLLFSATSAKTQLAKRSS